jgi:RCC1-like G exchanging factor-like protein
VFTWGYGILGKGPNVERSFIPEKIPEKLFGTSEFSNVKVVDIQSGVYHITALTGTK